MAVIELRREERGDGDAATATSHLVQEGVSGRWHALAGAWAARWGKAGREFPALQTGDEEFPERSDNSRHVQLQAMRALHDAAARFQHVALKAAEVTAAAGRRFVFDPQHRRQVPTAWSFPRDVRCVPADAIALTRHVQRQMPEPA